MMVLGFGYIMNRDFTVWEKYIQRKGNLSFWSFRQNKSNHLRSNAGPYSLCMIGRLHSGFEADSLHHKNCLYTRSSDTQSHTLDTRLQHHSRSLVEWDCHSMGFVLIFHANVHANQKSKKNSAA